MWRQARETAFPGVSKTGLGGSQPTRAEALLGRALKTAPDSALLWYQLGIARSAADHDAEAIAAFQKFVALDPEFTEARNSRARCR
jgi:predicted TPR repeat methyltransferase